MIHPIRLTSPFIFVAIALSVLYPANANDNRPRSDSWCVSFTLDTPHLVPPAVQYAVLDYDPVAGFVKRLQAMRKHYQQRLADTKDPSEAKLIRLAQIIVSWNLGFKEVTGDQVGLLVSSPDVSMNGHSSNGPGGKKWIVTKTVRLQGKPVCWCLPFEARLGQEPTLITLSESNNFDLETTFDKVMTETTDTKQAESQLWRVSLALDTPHLVPPAVQYAIFDKDPVPGFIKRVQSFRNAPHNQSLNADPSQAQWARQANMTVSWDLGFKEITGDKVYLLIAAPGTSHTVSSSGSGGQKWVVTKTVQLQDKPVCWCVRFEAKQGAEDTHIVLNESNMFELATTYDKSLAESGETK